MTEEWRVIPGWEGLYEASSLGRIRSLPRERNTRWGMRVFPGRTMRQYDSRTPNYLCVKLTRRDGTSSDCLVHRLVASAFHGTSPAESDLCRHLDGDSRNNLLSNLAWGTQRENMQDCLSHGTHSQASKSACKNGHPFTPENTYIRTGENGRACRACKSARARMARAERNAA